MPSMLSRLPSNGCFMLLLGALEDELLPVHGLFAYFVELVGKFVCLVGRFVC